MNPDLVQLAIGVGLGLLVGLERSWSDHEEAGVRTFTLITVLGVLAAIVDREAGGWVVASGVVAVVALMAVVNYGRHQVEARPDTGITTEVAALVMFLVGAALGAGLTVPAIVVGGGVAALLHWKHPLHDLADRMERKELEALIRLAVIGLVILPLMPNRDFGPYDVLNPFEIWFMVVLIVGISMAGYVAFRLFGARAGAVAAGLLGGLISSTATTVSYARRSKAEPSRSAAAALVITLASVVVFARVMVEIGVVGPGTFADVAPPLAILMVFMGVVAFFLFRGAGDEEGHEVADQEPPSELKAALIFGGLYAVVLLAVAFARERLGTSGLYFVAGISGLTDIDAITLSTARLMEGEGLDPSTGWRVVMVGVLSNLVFKAGVVFTLGTPKLKGRIAAAFGLTLAAGVALMMLWPG
ncbi:MAG TPA: MgtC/SapB family protein [Longimicrobiales bacterium]|nr:MgtC/SapB family protein [Longimicrobiales bacterium]